MSLDASLFRALSVYRLLALAYAVVSFALHAHHYRHPVGAAVLLAGMVGWTALTLWRYRTRRGRTWWLLGADLMFSCAALLATAWLDDPAAVAAGAPTLTTIWISAPVLFLATKGGWRWGVAAAVLVGAVTVLERGPLPGGGALGQGTHTLHNNVLLLLAALTIGYVVELARGGEQAMARALRKEAAVRVRDVLAREIHDNVLQVLTLVQRRCADIGGEATELGRLAGEQEAALRALVSSGWDADSLIGPGPAGDGTAPGTPVDLVDLGPLLAAYASPRTTVVSPGVPVEVLPREARGLTAAVGAALDNVRCHAGEQARAWILLEEEPPGPASPGRILVTVRDDGPGIPEGRLEDAAADGRLGIAQSIQGRLADLGGEAVVFSRPGEGTEVELSIPRTPRQP